MKKIKEKKDRLNKCIDELGFTFVEREMQLSGSTLGQYASYSTDKCIPEIKLKYLESLLDE